ncbi:hypothetical protein [Candidatus Gullanella endobia]|uniref:hypothetical protein n=1 Tax=Candidatus Gullanella endobia TaxID=1070130 RepID=UPI0013156E5C|nr:hypothetical protein [Candidatus Gullanella endobia]
MLTFNNIDRKYTGQPMMIIYDVLWFSLCNGDIGLLFQENKRHCVCIFVCRMIPLNQLPKHEKAFLR